VGHTKVLVQAAAIGSHQVTDTVAVADVFLL